MSEETEGARHSPQTPDQRRDAFVEHFAGSVMGAQEVLSIYIGDRLVLYQALAEGGALAAPELADAAGIHERYAREWLEQQAVCGFLDVDDASAEPNSRRFRLPEGGKPAPQDTGSAHENCPAGCRVSKAGYPNLPSASSQATRTCVSG